MYLLDTTIVSFAVRKDPVIERYDTEMQGNDPKFVSVQTIGELLIWAEKRNWGPSRLAKLRAVASKYSILPIDADTAEIYSKVRVGAERLGRSLSSTDAWILSTAIQYELTLVTHDRDMTVGTQLGATVICRV
jgi:predicted nucleic acid-binding protein